MPEPTLALDERLHALSMARREPREGNAVFGAHGGARQAHLNSPRLQGQLVLLNLQGEKKEGAWKEPVRLVK